MKKWQEARGLAPVSAECRYTARTTLEQRLSKWPAPERATHGPRASKPLAARALEGASNMERLLAGVEDRGAKVEWAWQSRGWMQWREVRAEAAHNERPLDFTNYTRGRSIGRRVRIFSAKLSKLTHVGGFN